MIDLNNVEKYRENNRIEAKKALGGLPKSIWETYSAFANTLGGVILLGVEEHKDKSFHPINLPDPQFLIDEFFRLLNDKKKVSLNILTKRHVQILKNDDKCFIAIFVPRASASDRPIYIDNDPFSGTYKRNGEGDYKATKEEILLMLNNAKNPSFDATPINTKFSNSSIVFLNSEYPDFLSSDTVAELLTFGKYDLIKSNFPDFKLLITENKQTEFKGNLFEFYNHVSNIFSKITENHETLYCLQEALVNAIVNTDYRVGCRIEIKISASHISFSNSGGFNVNLEDAKKGLAYEPRNPNIKKLFDRIRTDNFIFGGISHIHMIWQKNGWSAPCFEQTHDTTTLKLYFYNIDSFNNDLPGIVAAETIISYLTEHIFADSKELSAILNVSCIDNILSKLKENNIIISIERNNNTLYKLKD